MGSAPTGLIVEHHDPRRPFQVVAAVGPHIGPFGLALAGVKLLYRRFIRMQHFALLECYVSRPLRFKLRKNPEFSRVELVDFA